MHPFFGADFIDIVNDPVARGEYKTEEDTTLYVSNATGRGPLTSTWRDEFIQAQTVTHERWTRAPTRTADNRKADGPLIPLPKRIMCAYKLCRVEFRYWGMQKRVEQFIHDSGANLFVTGAYYLRLISFFPSVVFLFILFLKTKRRGIIPVPALFLNYGKLFRPLSKIFGIHSTSPIA